MQRQNENAVEDAQWGRNLALERCREVVIVSEKTSGARLNSANQDSRSEATGRPSLTLLFSASRRGSLLARSIGVLCLPACSYRLNYRMAR
jgi:hypothetical protein